MKATIKKTAAEKLLNFLRLSDGASLPTDTEAENTFTTFISDIRSLDARHNKGKEITQDRLAEQVFRRNPMFKKDRDAVPYFRYQLRVASEELGRLEGKMRASANGNITSDVLFQFAEIINDYLFDLRDILSFLQRKDNDWRFFEGGQNSDVTSWEVFQLAQGLAYQSTRKGTGVCFNHKTAQIASLFVLRQAMELRFERLIGVYPYDRNCKPPKLRHGFHHDFITKNNQFFNADDFSIKELRHLYDWSSEIVHQAYQPYAWQIAMALRRAGELLNSRSVQSGQAWSIFNSVSIADVDKMQTAYEEHFLNTYGHGEWCFTRRQPEAQLLSEYRRQSTLGTDYRQVRNRQKSFWPIKLLKILYPKWKS
ncbi:hypothetical protein J7481_25620 [Labrenzia sp. R4_2]|uniref:hypothetical protein n=1 Tax=Labrenzia sp. R4_2 TaxID=2821107 RepID=UPI001ADA3F8A|nr:hypothetical protein [Labrenzia sp. R4_2]MBO9422910.1 hypothetical protein [Labrenzia sp. R4_2]